MYTLHLAICFYTATDVAQTGLRHLRGVQAKARIRSTQRESLVYVIQLYQAQQQQQIINTFTQMTQI